VPDAIGSLLVARDGHGDMAVSNAIGSNVFDILLGLGVPWVMGAVIYGGDVEVDADNIVPLTLILFGTLVGVYVVTVCSGFRLTKLVGAIFFSMYFLFVAYVLMHEFHMISF
jgi:Ca2+/Na+ antiporter